MFSAVIYDLSNRQKGLFLPPDPPHPAPVSLSDYASQTLRKTSYLGDMWYNRFTDLFRSISSDFSLGFPNNRDGKGKHNAKLSLTEVRIALSAKANFFPDVSGRRE